MVSSPLAADGLDGCGHEAELCKDLDLVDVLALRLYQALTVKGTETAGFDGKSPVRRRQLTAWHGQGTGLRPLRDVLNRNRIALLDNALDRHMHIGKSAQEGGGKANYGVAPSRRAEAR